MTKVMKWDPSHLWPASSSSLALMWRHRHWWTIL
jgi:hypothetical protein